MRVTRGVEALKKVNETSEERSMITLRPILPGARDLRSKDGTTIVHHHGRQVALERARHVDLRDGGSAANVPKAHLAVNAACTKI